MDWVTAHKPRSITIEEFLKSEIIKETDSTLINLKVVGNIGYAAILNNQTNIVHAEVIMTGQDRKQYENFKYKRVHENENPMYNNCPKSIIKLLSTTNNGSASQWRKLCVELNKQQMISLKKLEHGCIVSFADPILFPNQISIDTFRVVKNGVKTHFVHDGKYYNVPKWKKRSFDVIEYKKSTL